MTSLKNDHVCHTVDASTVVVSNDLCFILAKNDEYLRDINASSGIWIRTKSQSGGQWTSLALKKLSSSKV